MVVRERPVAGFVLSLIASVFIMLNALIYAFLTTIFAIYEQVRYIISGRPIEVSFLFLPGFIILILTAIGLICGIIVLIGTYMLYRGKKTVGGIFVIIGSIISLTIGGGFFIGFLLGIIGGALGLAGV